MLVSEFERKYGGDCSPCQGCRDHDKDIAYLLVNPDSCVLDAICSIGRKRYPQWWSADFHAEVVPLSMKLLVAIMFQNPIVSNPPLQYLRNKQKLARLVLECHHEGRFKNLLKRATRRIVPYLILCEAMSTLWLCLNERPLVIARWWYFVLGFVSLALLAIWEHQRALPFSFMDHLTFEEFALAFVLAGGGLALFAFLPAILVSVTHQHWQNMGLGLGPYLSAALSVHAGISEESFKVALTNLVAKPFHKAFRRKESKTIDRVIVCVAGASAVALWAGLHIPFAYFSIGSVIAAFLGGMVCFGVILWLRNYLPVVVVHVLYDLFISLFLASSVFY